jgi:hypothetical protein
VVSDWICGQVDGIGYAIRDDQLTVAVLAPQSEVRFTITLCPAKMLRQRQLGAAAPQPVDPIVKAVCGLDVPPGLFHVWLFEPTPGDLCAM